MRPSEKEITETILCQNCESQPQVYNQALQDKDAWINSDEVKRDLYQLLADKAESFGWNMDVCKELMEIPEAIQAYLTGKEGE